MKTLSSRRQHPGATVGIFLIVLVVATSMGGMAGCGGSGQPEAEYSPTVAAGPEVELANWDLN